MRDLLDPPLAVQRRVSVEPDVSDLTEVCPMTGAVSYPSLYVIPQAVRVRLVPLYENDPADLRFLFEYVSGDVTRGDMQTPECVGVPHPRGRVASVGVRVSQARAYTRRFGVEVTRRTCGLPVAPGLIGRYPAEAFVECAIEAVEAYARAPYTPARVPRFTVCGVGFGTKAVGRNRYDEANRHDNAIACVRALCEPAVCLAVCTVLTRAESTEVSDER